MYLTRIATLVWLAAITMGQTQPQTAVFEKKPCQVLTCGTGWPLPVEQVRQALRSSPALERYGVARLRITLPAGFETKSQAPALQLVKLRRAPAPRSLLAEMRCRVPGVCLRFIVTLQLPDAPDSETWLRSLFNCGAQSVSVRRGGPAGEAPAFLVQPGEMASLVFEGVGIRISEAVRPLGRARMGETVRVSDPSTHRILRAQVVGYGRLRPADPAAGSRAEAMQ